MLSTIYERQKKRRAELIKKLFEDIAQETIEPENIYRVKLSISETTKTGVNWCCSYADGTCKIKIEINAIKRRVLNGYENCYYSDRKLRVDKYVLHNKHNAIRFALYHELKHAKDRLIDREKETSEFDADGWAIKHLEGVK